MRNIKSLFFAFLAVFLFCFPVNSFSGFPIPPLPPFILPAPPIVVPVPGKNVYIVPDTDIDIVFYHDYWYRPFNGRWYRSHGYNGPWFFVSGRQVPSPVVTLQPGFRHRYSGRDRIPYGQMKKNWRNWEHERHWERRHEEARERFREERREHRDVREERREVRKEHREHRDKRGHKKHDRDKWDD